MATRTHLQTVSEVKVYTFFFYFCQSVCANRAVSTSVLLGTLQIDLK